MGMIDFGSADGTAYTFAGGNTSDTATWTHTGITGRNGLAVVSAMLTTAGGASSSVSATYGGTAMTLHGVAVGGSGSALRLALFTLLNPPTGSQTVAITWSGLSFTIPSKVITATAETYRNCMSVSGYTANTGYGTSSGLTLTGVTQNQLQVFAHGRQTATAFSSYVPGQRYTTATGTSGRIVAGDTTNNTGSVTSTATMSASDYYLAHGIIANRFAKGDFFG